MKSKEVKNHNKLAVKIGRFEIHNDIMFQIIINYMSEYYGVRFTTLLLGKKKEVILKRQVIQYLLTIFTTYSLSEIGYLTGMRDHASVHHAKDVVNNEMEIYELFRVEVNAIYDGIEKLLLNQLNE